MMEDHEKPKCYTDYNFRFQIEESDWNWLQKHVSSDVNQINNFLIKCLSRGYGQLKKEMDEKIEHESLLKGKENHMRQEPAYMRRTLDHAVDPPSSKQTSWDFWNKDK